MVHQIWTNNPASYDVFRSRWHYPRSKQGYSRMFRKADSVLLAIGFMAILSVSAHADPNCLNKQKPFTLTGDTIVWTMYAAPGSECIRGLRWSYMQIYSVSVLKAPTKGKISIVGPAFRYFAASKDYDADSFTLEVVGKNRRDPGKSTVEIVVK